MQAILESLTMLDHQNLDSDIYHLYLRQHLVKYQNLIFHLNQGIGILQWVLETSDQL